MGKIERLLITHSMNHFMRDDGCKEYFSFTDNENQDLSGESENGYVQLICVPA